MKYYIYSHTRLDTGNIFYIGKGTKKLKGQVYNRAYTKSSRNPYWKNIVKKSAYYVSIMQEFDNESDCLAEETRLILLYGRICNNTGSLCNIVKDDYEIKFLARQSIGDSRKIHVYQYDIDGNFIKSYSSITCASKELHLSLSDISLSVKGVRHLVGGFQWKNYKQIKIPAFNKLKSYNHKNFVDQYDLSGNFIKQWNNVSQISRDLNIGRSGICNCLSGISKSSAGYVWRYNIKTAQDKEQLKKEKDGNI
jgi:hypothetical protein